MDNLYLYFVGQQLKTFYNENKKKYFNNQKYNRLTGFLGSVVAIPGQEKFFGPKVLNLLILSDTYGWQGDTFVGIDDDTQIQIDRIKSQYKIWSKYKTFIWFATKLSDEVKAKCPASNILDKIAQTQTMLAGICDQLKDYGFEYKGTISDIPQMSFFQPLIDDFYSDSESTS